MLFSVTELQQKAVHQPFSFDEKIDVSDIVHLKNDIRKISSVNVKGFCTVDEEEIIFQLHIEGEMILPCSRTLVDVAHQFSFDVTEIFTSNIEDIDFKEETNVHEIVGDNIDLRPLIEENIILETPYRVFSDEKMIDKGKGWEFHTEDLLKEKKENEIDPRLSKLRQFLHDKK